MEHKQTENVIITSVDESQGIVEAIWAVMGNIDQGNDIIHPGAFKKTFNERGNQIKLLDNHRTQSVMDALGTVLELKELRGAELPQELMDTFPDAIAGAWGKFQFQIDTPEGDGAFKRIKSKAIKGWSFGYDAINPDRTTVNKDGKQIPVRNLREIKLFEISPVLFPMNEAATTTDVKNNSSIEEEKLLFENKAINLDKMVDDVRSAFYSQYPDIFNDDPRFRIIYYVKQIWDEFIIVKQRGTSGRRLWKITYQINDQNIVVFASPQDWVEVTIAIVPLANSTQVPDTSITTDEISIMSNSEPSISDKTLTSNEAEPDEEKDTHLLQLINIELEEMEV